MWRLPSPLRTGHLVSSLVIVDSGPEIRPLASQKTTNFMALPSEADSVEEFVERAMRFNPRRSRQQLRVSLLNNLKRTAAGKWTWKYDRRSAVPPPGAAPLQRGQKEEFVRAMWAAVHQISCPALVVRGAESDRILDEDAERLAHELHNGHWVKITGSGHVIQGINHMSWRPR